MRKLKLIALLLTILSFTNSHAQEIWQVDSRVAITSTTVGTYSVKVTADNDDAARSPKLIVSLPRNCKVETIALGSDFNQTPYQIMGNANLALGHDPQTTDSYIEFDIRNLNREDFNVKISIVSVNDGFRRKSSLAAFVYGITPEANKGNNYAIYPIN